MRRGSDGRGWGGGGDRNVRGENGEWGGMRRKEGWGGCEDRLGGGKGGG